jgi:putative radical SAM enzyme (TIGR03279 family)
MIRVTHVHADSIADDLGLMDGTELLAVNDRPLDDFLDWEFLTADDRFELLVRQPGGEEIAFDIERPEDHPMGVTLEPPRIRRCANRCDFCFVDGLPEGMREVMYIRDDDYRLSFRYGNFATLTNLKPKDVARIIEYQLSPLYVSVHATDPVVRRHLLRNPLAPDVVAQIREFADHGIQFHTQIVMSPGVNDGPHLQRTLTDLWHLGDPILDVSVVPVGLTEFSKHQLCREPTAAECLAALDLIEPLAERARAERGHPWVFGSDELYLRAGKELPPAEAYGGFEQVENGVGSVRYLQRRIAESAIDPETWRGRSIAVLTGTSMGPLMPQVLAPLGERTAARFDLVALENPIFGDTVTTAGLLPGRAFQEALASRNDLDLALLPAESVNDDGLFIDDMSLDQLVESTSVPVRLSYDFVDVLDGSGERGAG